MQGESPPVLVKEPYSSLLDSSCKTGVYKTIQCTPAHNPQKRGCCSMDRNKINFDTNLIKIGGELRKLWTTEYCNIGGMGAAILNI